MAFGQNLINSEFGEQANDASDYYTFNILDIKFISPDNKFFIAQVEQVVDDYNKNNQSNNSKIDQKFKNKQSKTLSLKGSLENINQSWVGKQVKCSGEFDYNETFGEEFKATLVLPIMPKTSSGIYKFFTNKIKGIGTTTLDKMVNHFGDDLLRVMDNYPEQLLDFISIEKATLLVNYWNQEKKTFDIKVKLNEYGLNETQITNALDYFGSNILETIKKDPYEISAVEGIGFKTADYMALSMGIANNDPKRVRAATLYLIEDKIEKTGSTVISSSEVTQLVKKQINTTDSLIEKCFKSLEKNNKIVLKESFINNQWFNTVTTYRLDQDEQTIAYYMNQLLNGYSKPINTTVISDQFDKSQQNAIKTVFKEKLCVITGGPGTGKTSVTKAILSLAEDNGLQNIHLMAPTGKAAKRMEQITNKKALTIHKALKFNPVKEGPDKFAYNENRKLPSDLVLLDESSMIDTHLMASLLKAISHGSRVSFIGDMDQLPSVGPGQVFKDLIQSSTIPVCQLQYTYRTGSELSKVANAVNHCQMPQLNSDKNNDFCFIEKGSDNDSINQEIEKQVKTLLDQNVSPNDIQIITPQWNQSIGVSSLNEQMKSIFNREWSAVAHNKQNNSNNELVFKKGDRVIQTKNNHKKEIFNGDIGIIKRVSNHDMSVDFEVGSVELTRKEMNQVRHAYAYTVHKSQGSEMPYVIIPLSKSHIFTWNKQVLYTAITRAKKQCIMIGDSKFFKTILNQKNVKNRYTNLKQRLNETVHYNNDFFDINKNNDKPLPF